MGSVINTLLYSGNGWDSNLKSCVLKCDIFINPRTDWLGKTEMAGLLKTLHKPTLFPCPIVSQNPAVEAQLSMKFQESDCLG